MGNESESARKFQDFVDMGVENAVEDPSFNDDPVGDVDDIDSLNQSCGLNGSSRLSPKQRLNQQD